MQTADVSSTRRWKRYQTVAGIFRSCLSGSSLRSMRTNGRLLSRKIKSAAFKASSAARHRTHSTSGTFFCAAQFRQRAFGQTASQRFVYLRQPRGPIPRFSARPLQRQVRFRKFFRKQLAQLNDIGVCDKVLKAPWTMAVQPSGIFGNAGMGGGRGTYWN